MKPCDIWKPIIFSGTNFCSNVACSRCGKRKKKNISWNQFTVKSLVSRNFWHNFHTETCKKCTHYFLYWRPEVVLGFTVTSFHKIFSVQVVVYDSVISTIAMKDQYGNWHGPIQDMVKFWLLARMTEKSSFGGRSTDHGLNCTSTLNMILRSILCSGHHTNMD